MSLAACVPFYASQYYEPSASSGRLEGPGCARPSDALHFDFDRVLVTYSTSPDKQGITVVMTFTLPDGYNARLLEYEALVRRPEDTSPIRARFVESVVVGERRRQAVTEPMVGASKRIPGFGDRLDHRGYILTADIPYTPETFRIMLPRFSINDVSHTLPEITVIRKRHFTVLQPFFC